MVTVPSVANRQQQTRPVSTQTFGTQLDAPKLNLPEQQYNSSAGRAVERLGNTVMNATFDAVNEAKSRADKISLIDAQRQLDEWETKSLYDPNTGALSQKGKAAFDLPNKVGADYQQFTKGIYENLPNDTQRSAFMEMANSRKTTIDRTLLRHERGEMDQYADKQTQAAAESSINRAVQYFNNPDVVDHSINSAKDIIRLNGEMNGLPPEAISNKQQELESKARIGVLTRWSDSDPKAAMDYYKSNMDKFTAPDLMQAQRMIVPVERKYKATDVAKNALAGSTPVVSRDDAINFVMNDLEGGDKLVSDGGGVAKFGINSKANPDVDVANLTPEKAKEIYKSKYWDAIGADKLPADMRAVAFDTAVNHGVEKAKELIAQSDNDPRKLIELRSQEYDRLAKADPEKYGANIEGWKNRLGKLQTQVDTMRGGLPDEYALYQKIDASTNDLEVADDAKKLVKSQIEALKQSRKVRDDAANDEAWGYVSQNKEVPASVEARMSPKDVNEMRRAAPDPALYEQLRTQISTGQDVNLSDYRWRLGGKFDDLVKLQGDPNKQVNARKVDDVIKNASGILLGRSTPKGEEDFKTIEGFRRAVDAETSAIEKATGKPATAQDVEKITDKLLLQTKSPHWWNSDKKMFQLNDGEEYEIDGVPSDRKYFINGAPQNYDSVIQTVTSYLQKKNKAVNPENIAETYKALVNQNLIVEKE